MITPQSQPDSVPEGNLVPRNLYQCGTCSQSYSRIDHLRRHILSRRSLQFPVGSDLSVGFADKLLQTPRKSLTNARCVVSASAECVASLALLSYRPN